MIETETEKMIETETEELELEPEIEEYFEKPSRMRTEKVPVSNAVKNSPALAKRLKSRLMKAEEWIDKHASGTLRKNKRIGFAWMKQYREERVCWEFGWEFELTPSSRVTFNDAITEGDTKGLTEAGWHIDKYITQWPFPEDKFETKYIIVEYEGGTRREGAGLICRKTSAPFVPKGYLVFAIVSEFDREKDEFLEASNPC